MTRVAIIDDDESVRKTISDVLSASGIKTTIFDSTSSFLDSARIEDFQVMLVDKDMPGMTGLEFYELMKSQNLTLPKFILMSGTFSTEETSEAVAFKTPILLAKPFRLSQLLKLIETN
jgi:DNA-binding NtrC family response regulator